MDLFPVVLSLQTSRLQAHPRSKALQSDDLQRKQAHAHPPAAPARRSVVQLLPTYLLPT